MEQHHPIIQWMGGKRRLAPFILKRMPAHTCYVEAFAGGAAVFFAKTPAKVEVLNDLNGELINLYRVIQHHLEEFVRQFKWALSSRKLWEWERAKLPETLTDIQRAARFYYLQRLSFGGKVEGRSFGTSTTSPPRLNLLRIEEDLSQAHLRLHRTLVESLPWQEIVRRYDRPHTLHYLDPPYWGTAGYGQEFGWDQYEEMARLAHDAKGAVMISINDHPDIRRCFEGLHIESVGLRHTVGGGRGVQARELLVRNQQCLTEDLQRVSGNT
jgi:DNA adenine methylase